MNETQIASFKRALFAARVEREKVTKQAMELDRQRALIHRQVTQLNQTIHGLAVLCGEENIDDPEMVIEGIAPEMALADACRKVLSASDRYMSPVRVRNELQLAHYPLTSKNPLAAIHGILKRFEASGEAESLPMGRKTGYRLKRLGPDLPDAKPRAKKKGKEKEETVD
jgi:hypothetical protein